MYSVGDYVVKANNGVCVIEDITKLKLSDIDKDKLYYVLTPIENKNTKLYVPVESNKNVLRYAIDEATAWEIIKRIPDIEATWVVNDKQREQQYKQAILSCKPEELVGIIKTMYQRNMERSAQGKKNTAIDERYFKLAEHTLYSELAFALGKEKSEMSALIADMIHSKA